MYLKKLGNERARTWRRKSRLFSSNELRDEIDDDDEVIQGKKAYNCVVLDQIGRKKYSHFEEDRFSMVKVQECLCRINETTCCGPSLFYP